MIMAEDGAGSYDGYNLYAAVSPMEHSVAVVLNIPVIGEFVDI